MTQITSNNLLIDLLIETWIKIKLNKVIRDKIEMPCKHATLDPQVKGCRRLPDTPNTRSSEESGDGDMVNRNKNADEVWTIFFQISS